MCIGTYMNVYTGMCDFWACKCTCFFCTIVMAYIVMAYTVYMVMAHICMAYILMACMVTGHVCRPLFCMCV